MGSYVIEPKPKDDGGDRSIHAKLDTILSHIKGGKGSGEGAGGPVPEVSFEPEIEHLPLAPGPEEDKKAGAKGQGEGTANVADVDRAAHSAFRHPSRRKAATVTTE